MNKVFGDSRVHGQNLAVERWRLTRHTLQALLKERCLAIEIGCLSILGVTGDALT